MATHLVKKKIHGRFYWYAVESARVDGKPRSRYIAYLGSAQDIVRRKESEAAPRSFSRSHGVVSALKRLAGRLRIAETIDETLPQRERSSIASVGTTLLLAAIGRAAHPTSKRGFAAWAATTTIPRLFGVNVAKMTSPFFWDQMDLVPEQALAIMESQILARAVREFGVTTDLLLYDTTNFFTYIATDNKHCDLPQRGDSKQRRNDLRQMALALLVSRDGGVPLGSYVYRGNRNDVSVFTEAFAALRERLTVMAVAIESITFVYDKGNVSKANQERLEGVGYVTALVPSHHKDLLAQDESSSEALADGTRVWRARKHLWGKEQTVVMLVSEQLRQGQRAGLDQHLGKALLRLERIRQGLRAARRRRPRAAVETAVAGVCEAPQLKGVVTAKILERRPGFFDLDYHVDMERYEQLCAHFFGRRLLVTNREQWSTQEIVAAYRGQAHVERAFRTVKDPFHLAVRPQYHWTDQKIRVHIFCCLMGYLLASLMLREARRAGWTCGSRQMLDLLEQVRLATYIEERGEGRPGRPKMKTRLEDCSPDAMRLYHLFVPEEEES